MSISAEDIARLITEECGITRDLGHKQDHRLSKEEMVRVYAYLRHLKTVYGDMEKACALVKLDPDLIDTLKRLNLLGKDKA